MGGRNLSLGKDEKISERRYQQEQHPCNEFRLLGCSLK
jgi:hypothetical protein